MVHQVGWGQVYPDALSVDNFTTSIACREAARLQCVSPGWHHPENDCPSGAPFTAGNAPRSPLQGTCETADCDCTEFFHQALLMSIGQRPGWFGTYMPETQKEMKSMLSTEFKDMIQNPTYGLPTAPFKEAALKNCYENGSQQDDSQSEEQNEDSNQEEEDNVQDSEDTSTDNG